MPLEQAAQEYGVQVERGGMAHCPFHGADRHPSMKIYPNGFKCFTCGEHGDVIDLVAKLLGLPPVDAAKELNNRYGLGLTIGRAATPQERRKQKQAAEQRRKKQALTQALDAWETRAWVTLSSYYRILSGWREQSAPPTPSDLDKLHPLYLEAQKRDYIGYCLDQLNGDRAQKTAFFQTHRNEVNAIEQRMQRL